MNIYKIIVPVVLFVLVLLFSFTTVPAGYVGIVTSFGDVEQGVLDPGLHVLLPWKRVTRLSVQTVEDKETASIPTKEGLSVDLDVSVLFRLRKESAVHVYQTVGVDYVSVIVQPTLRSALRSAAVFHAAKDLYTAKRGEIETALTTTLAAQLSLRGIEVESVLLRDITLPKKVKDSIEQKLSAEQDSEKMQFVLTKERQESERRKIEAQGIADAQEVINKTLTTDYIRYLWVKALENNAQHPSTIIYVPIGSDGLPIVATVGKGK